METDPRRLGNAWSGSMLPWLLALAVLIVVVAWMLVRNNRLPERAGALEGPAVAAWFADGAPAVPAVQSR